MEPGGRLATPRADDHQPGRGQFRGHVRYACLQALGPDSARGFITDATKSHIDAVSRS